jgi:hypothetical protein
MITSTLRRLDAAANTLVFGVVGTWGFGVAMVGIYMIKSSLGIDLMDGPSFLHDFYLG